MPSLWEDMAPLARCLGAVVDVEINGLGKQRLVINLVNVVLRDLVREIRYFPPSGEDC